MEENKNLALYNRVRSVPDEAKGQILAGRLKGKTDIDPVWRIETLTREFGPAGVGWYTKVVDTWVHEGDGQKALYIHLNLFIKQDGEWSAPIEGFGGQMILSKEKAGMYLDDDAYKKAYTDAISQACRSLGIAADVYWGEGATKYTNDRAAIEYIESLSSAQELDWAWGQYGEKWKSSKEIIKLFNQKKKEFSNGTAAHR